MSISKILFSFEGRINRAPYWGYGILSMIIINAIIIGMGFTGNPTLIKFSLLLYIPSLWISFALLVKRLHDLDKSGWMALLLFVPLVNLYIGIIACFIKGTDGKNQYGVNPLGNNTNTTSPNTAENKSIEL